MPANNFTDEDRDNMALLIDTGIMTQRQVANLMGVSLGTVQYQLALRRSDLKAMRTGSDAA